MKPRYWLTGLSLCFLVFIAQWPLSWVRGLGRLLGRLAFHLLPRRRYIADRNLSACFPTLDTGARRRLLQTNFAEMGASLLEFGVLWWRCPGLSRPQFQVEGWEHLKNHTGGVLFLLSHSVAIEALSYGLAQAIPEKQPLAFVYRPAKNRLFDRVQWQARQRYHPALTAFSLQDIRGLVRHLRASGWATFSPDQDFGMSRRSVFVPFFDIPTATVKTTARLAELGHAKVFPLMGERLKNGNYRLTIQPAWENFPSDDPEADARRVNSSIEEAVRACPEQYLWVHRRFKTRPPGEPPFYGDSASKS